MIFVHPLLAEHLPIFSSSQMTFVWRRGRGLYVRTLFVGARYASLAIAILNLFSVSSAKLVNNSDIHSNQTTKLLTRVARCSG
jgi:hypothetical protein